MKILLYGSIAAGKTSLAKKIITQHENFQYLSIDNFRRKYGDGTWKNERIAQRRFIDAFSKNTLQIIEASGVGNLGYSIFNKLISFKEKVLIIVLLIDLQETEKRVKERRWDIPYPESTKMISHTADSINKKIIAGNIFSLWGNYTNATIIHLCQNNTDMSFLIKTINNYIKQIVK